MANWICKVLFLLYSEIKCTEVFVRFSCYELCTFCLWWMLKNIDTSTCRHAYAVIRFLNIWPFSVLKWRTWYLFLKKRKGTCPFLGSWGVVEKHRKSWMEIERGYIFYSFMQIVFSVHHEVVWLKSVSSPIFDRRSWQLNAIFPPFFSL